MCSEQAATRLYPEPDESSSHSLSTPWSYEWVFIIEWDGDYVLNR